MRFNYAVVSLCVTVAFGASRSSGAAADRPDVVFADFEGDDYGPWTATGDAFGNGPARGALPHQMPVGGFAGRGLVNSFHGGDRSVGTLTSPEFTIDRTFIRFLIGGGGFDGRTCVNLLVGGKIVRTATGPNTEPGGSEDLAPDGWDVGEFAGRAARIEVVDRATGGWGHINLDEIVFTDHRPTTRPANRVTTAASREIVAERRWLWFPVRSGATKQRVEVTVDGKVERYFAADLADGEPEWWAPLDIRAWRGKTLVVKVDKLPADSKVLTAVRQSDEWDKPDELYREPLRPQFHFSARRGWLNDPNGLAFYNGEYHLFFQHCPPGWGGGTKWWGHAVSRDLVHWQEVDEALYADEMGEMYSGSAVVDWHNTSGFGRDGKPPLVLIYTAAGQPFTQCLAYSTDGRQFTKFAGNPVVKNVTPGNRDPKVFWHEATRRWVMAVYVGLPSEGAANDAGGKAATRHTVHFYTSPNLRDWTLASVSPGGLGDEHFLYECPDVYPLPLDGDAAKAKWVLSGANAGLYTIGGFDGAKFTPDVPQVRGFVGRSFYAAQTFSDEPNGRRIQIGWVQARSPGMPFNQCMSVPMDLSLRTTPDGPRLFRWPVRELEQLRVKAGTFPAGPLKPGDDPLAGAGTELMDVELAIDPGAARTITLNVRGTPIGYDVAKGELTFADRRTPLPLVGGALHLRALSDRTVLEIFGADGLTYVAVPVQPKPGDVSLVLTCAGGEAKILSLKTHELRSAWPDRPVAP